MSTTCNAQKVGYVVTNNNDTIKAYSINTNALIIPNPFYPIKSPTYMVITQLKPKKKVKMSASDIRELKVMDLKQKDTSTYLLIGDTVTFKIYMNKPSSKFNFLTLEKKKLVRRDTQIISYKFWKVLYTKNNLSICNLNWTVNDAMSIYENNEYRDYEALAIISNKNKKTPIYTWEPRGNPKKDIPELSDSLLKFINIRYNLIMPSGEVNQYMDGGKDIEHQTRLFELILDKEAELEKMQEGELYIEPE